MNATRKLLLQPNIYAPLPLWLIYLCIFPVLSLIFGGFLFWIFYSSPDAGFFSRGGLLLGALFLPVSCITLFLGLSRARLIITPEGIIFRSMGYRLYTPWENIERLDQTWRGNKMVTGLVLREPAIAAESITQGIHMRRSVLVLNPFLRLLGIWPRDWMIPFENFARDLKNSKLAQDIQRYAPQLLAD